MPFTTKLDFTNRQAKQYETTKMSLSGSTCFGLCFSALTSGVDITTTGISESYGLTLSTFSGNTGTTAYVWADSRMSLGEPVLSAITPSNSATTQNTGNIFAVSSSTVIDGNTVNLSYSGVSFDVDVVGMISLGAGNYSGSVTSNTFDVLSADTLDFTGRTIWVDVSGITRTKELIVSNPCGATPPTIGHVLTCSDSEGLAVWAAATSGAVDTNTYISGASINCGNNLFTLESTDGVNIDTDLTCLVFSGGSGNCISDLWVTNVHGCSPITVWDSVQANGSTATGTTAFAFGNSVSAWGNYSQAWGDGTISTGFASHAEGENTVSQGTGSHAEGQSSSATTSSAHAEGSSTLASGLGSHAEGLNTIASGPYGHAEGNGSTAINETCHAEGISTIASAAGAHAEGQLTLASGQGTHAEGISTIANAAGAHAEGTSTLASGSYAHAEGSQTSATTFWSHASGKLTLASAYGSHVGGSGNTITFSSDYSAILGGMSHLIDAAADTAYRSFIGGGQNGLILKSDDAAIIGGVNNIISEGDFSICVGGSGNTANGENIVILGGQGITGSTPNTVYTPDIIVQSGKGISFGTGNTMVFHEIQIGDWDMDATTTLTVAHGLSATEFKTVRNMSVTIRDDADTLYYDQYTMLGGLAQTNLDSTNFNLRRDVAGIYDTTDFDSTTYNRGWINFSYTPD